MIHHIGIVASENTRLRLLEFMTGLGVVGCNVFSKHIEVWECNCFLYSLNGGVTCFEVVVPYGGKLLAWLREHGPTLHHMAVQVVDVVAMTQRLVKLGVPMVAEHPVEGVAGTLVNFIHPRYLGIMIELVQVRDGAT